MTLNATNACQMTRAPSLQASTNRSVTPPARREGPRTASEWLDCTDPKRMLEALRGRASDRKLRLFACACCRTAWEYLNNPRDQQAVEVVERFADGLATQEELTAAAAVAAAARAEADTQAA